MKTVGTIITLIGAILLFGLFIILELDKGTDATLIASALAGIGIVGAGAALMFRP